MVNIKEFYYNIDDASLKMNLSRQNKQFKFKKTYEEYGNEIKKLCKYVDKGIENIVTKNYKNTQCS